MDSVVTEAGSTPAEGQARVAAPRIVLPSWRLIAYGSLALPLSLAEIPILLYLPAFYAREVGLNAGVVGLAFLVARVWDGLSDVLVGWLSDRSQSRWGRRKPWVIVGAPFLMIATWFLCNPPQSAGVIYLVVWAVLFYAADTVVKIPYLSWGTELATDYVERSRVTAFRGTFFMLGTLFFVSAPLVFLPDGASLNSVLFLISLSVLVIVPLTAIPLGLFVGDHSSRVTFTDARFFKALIDLARDRVLVVFGVAMLFYFVANGTVNSLAVFSFGVGLQLPDKLFLVIFILYISSLCALPFMMRLARRAQKHQLLAGAFLLEAVVYGSHLLVPSGSFPTVAALWIVTGIANAAAIVLPTSMLADIVDHGEVTARERRPGAYMAIYNLIMKIGLALGVGLSFGLLDLVGYDPSATKYSATDAFNIRLLGFALPALLLGPAILLIWKHPITRKVQQQLRSQIEARNGAARND